MEIKRGLFYTTLFLSILGVIVISACSPDDKIRFSPKVKLPQHHLQPNDLDYPKLNTAPKQIVKFNAVIPDGFSKEFHLHYDVEYKQDYPNNSVYISPPGCNWTNESQFSINRSVELKQESGNLYTATLVLDYFLAGACKWHFRSMSSPMFGGDIFYYSESAHANPHPHPNLNLETEAIHIWCTEKYRRNKKDEPNPKLLN